MANDDRYKKREKDFKASVDTKRMFAKSNERLSGDKVSKTTISSSDYNKFSESFARGDHLLDDAVRENWGPFMYVIDTLQGDIEDIHTEVSASVYDSTVGEFLHFETGSFTTISSSLIPRFDEKFDLGSSNAEWKDLYIDGTANVDTLNVGGTNITATAAELNILDGVTATTAELNIMDGVTATTAELNKMDGVTATTAELNYTDGVTSAIQTQLNKKFNTDGTTQMTGPLNKLWVEQNKGVESSLDARKWDVIEFTAKKASTVTGITPNHKGQVITIVNSSSTTVTLKYNSKYAEGGGLMYLGGKDLSIAAKTSKQLVCTGAGYWILIS